MSDDNENFPESVQDELDGYIATLKVVNMDLDALGANPSSIAKDIRNEVSSLMSSLTSEHTSRDIATLDLCALSDRVLAVKERVRLEMIKTYGQATKSK